MLFGTETGQVGFESISVRGSGEVSGSGLGLGFGMGSMKKGDLVLAGPGLQWPRLDAFSLDSYRCENSCAGLSFRAL